MRPSPVRVILSGIGGMGYHYAEALLYGFSGESVQVAAAVDPSPKSSSVFPRLRAAGIPVYPSLESCFEAGAHADLVVLAVPIQHHVAQACLALQQGSHVLCEKPLAAVVQDADRLIRLKNRLAGRVSIGYQWCFTPAIQELKRDILKGRFGRPVRMKSLCLWPRDLDYYRRNDWAGCIQNKERCWVLDSPANNAMAHFLHIMFYCIGEEPYSSASPLSLEAEVFRAYPIENYDTLALRILAGSGTELLFYASHAAALSYGPIFEFEFEKAHIRYQGPGSGIAAYMKDGTLMEYGDPDNEPFQKLFRAVDAVKKNLPVLCGPEAARPQTICINGIQDSIRSMGRFPGEKIRTDKNGRWWVRGLNEGFRLCYESNQLPSEAGLGWGDKGRSVNLSGYDYFPGGQTLGKEGI